ncbi:MAG TPA: DUF177 domain-containing protein [Pyrinomonadaceae bacterium]|nr:DUF177 domain-containing protein [Pyrinomonadaceae bacterium]
MIIELSSIDIGTHPFEITVPASELDLDLDGVKLTGTVEANGEVVKSIAQTDVRGHIAADAEIDCVRCLQPVKRDLAIDFEVSFVDPEHFSVDKEKEVTAGDLEKDVLFEPLIDLKDLVREQIVLDVPAQVFCRDDCKGLCQKCGANLNLIDCNCSESEIDPRWSALKNLK